MLEEHAKVKNLEDERKKFTKKVKTFFGVTISLFFVLWGLIGIVFRSVLLPDVTPDSEFYWGRFQAYQDYDALIAGIHLISYGVLIYSLYFTFPNNYASPFWRRIWLTVLSLLVYFITFVIICNIVAYDVKSIVFILINIAVFTAFIVAPFKLSEILNKFT